MTNEFIEAAGEKQQSMALNYLMSELRERIVAQFKKMEVLMASARYEYRGYHSLENQRIKVVLRKIHGRVRGVEGASPRTVEGLRQLVLDYIRNTNEAIAGSMESSKYLRAELVA